MNRRKEDGLLALSRREAWLLAIAFSGLCWWSVYSLVSLG